MSPLQSFTQRAEKIRRNMMEGITAPSHEFLFTAEEIAAVSQELTINDATHETAKREISESIKKLENLYSEFAPTRLPVLRANNQ